MHTQPLPDEVKNKVLSHVVQAVVEVQVRQFGIEAEQATQVVYDVAGSNVYPG
jgi:hypothetical protein